MAGVFWIILVSGVSLRQRSKYTPCADYRPLIGLDPCPYRIPTASSPSSLLLGLVGSEAIVYNDEPPRSVSDALLRLQIGSLVSIFFFDSSTDIPRLSSPRSLVSFIPVSPHSPSVSRSCSLLFCLSFPPSEGSSFSSSFDAAIPHYFSSHTPRSAQCRISLYHQHRNSTLGPPSHNCIVTACAYFQFFSTSLKHRKPLITRHICSLH